MAFQRNAGQFRQCGATGLAVEFSATSKLSNGPVHSSCCQPERAGWFSYANDFRDGVPLPSTICVSTSGFFSPSSSPSTTLKLWFLADAANAPMEQILIIARWVPTNPSITTTAILGVVHLPCLTLSHYIITHFSARSSLGFILP